MSGRAARLKAVISSNFGEITAFAPVAGCTGSVGSGCLDGSNCAVGAGLRKSQHRRRSVSALSGGDLDYQRCGDDDRTLRIRVVKR